MEHLAEDLARHGFRGGNPGNDDRGRSRQHQRRNLRYQTITDGQQGVVAYRDRGLEIVLENTNRKPADDVDEED